ncbi:CMRF35-like molecule 3 [Hoplias malabaricus]|uniref:CMRF35-like molecule 3 n=1 Tax=Hoplias malabaricus TaxID=27720 RepID=UPI003461DE5F
MWTLVLLLSGFLTAGVNAVRTVTGLRGHSVQIHCPYDSGYESNTKYLCRGECSTLLWSTKDIPVDSGSAKDQRFSLKDDTVNRVFNITITDLRTEDAGKYWCGIGRALPLRDDYTEITLLVKLDNFNNTTVLASYPPSAHTLSTAVFTAPSTGQQRTSTPNVPHSTSSSTTHNDKTGPSDPVMYISVGLAFVMIVLLVAMTALYKQKRSTKRTKDKSIPLSAVPADPEMGDRIYQEIEEREQKPGEDSTNSPLYSTIEPPDLFIYNTPTPSQQGPQQSLSSTVYSTVNSTKHSAGNSTIYSAVRVPK